MDRKPRTPQFVRPMLVALALALAAGPSSAEDLAKLRQKSTLGAKIAPQGLQPIGANTITLQVPVQLDKMIVPGDKTAQVYCSVRNAGKSTLGTATVDVPLGPAGSYNGTLAVPVQANEGKALGEAASYACQLQFRRKDGQGAVFFPSPGSSDVWARPKSGTPFVKVVEGALQP